MSNKYRTAHGKTLDIEKLRLQNEDTIAVGNMKVNARGDAIGAGGKVTASRNQIMDKVYAVPSEGYSPNNPEVYKQRKAIMANNKAQELNNLVNNLTVPISQDPTPETTAPPARGSPPQPPLIPTKTRRACVRRRRATCAASTR